MSKWSSFKEDQLITESWRSFLNEEYRSKTGAYYTTTGADTKTYSKARVKEILDELNLEPEVYLPVAEKILSTELETKDRCAKSKIDFIMCMFEATCEVLNLDALTRKRQLKELEINLKKPGVNLEQIAKNLLDKVKKQIEAGIESAADCDKLRIKQAKQITQKTDLGQL